MERSFGNSRLFRCGFGGIKRRANRLTLCLTLFCAAAGGAYAAPAEYVPKVAVYIAEQETDELKVLSTLILEAFVNSEKYVTIERSKTMLQQVANEHVAQRGGDVDDSQIKQLGKQAGVDYICVIAATPVFGVYQVSSRLIDVETARVIKIGVTDSPMKNSGDVNAAAGVLVQKMLNPGNPLKTAANEVVGTMLGAPRRAPPPLPPPAPPPIQPPPEPEPEPKYAEPEPVETDTAGGWGARNARDDFRWRVGVVFGYDFNALLRSFNGAVISGLIDGEGDIGMGGGAGLSFKYGNKSFSVAVEPTFEYRRVGGWKSGVVEDYVAENMVIFDAHHHVKTVSITEMRLSTPIMFQIHPHYLSRNTIYRNIQKDKEKRARKGKKPRKYISLRQVEMYYIALGAQIGVPFATTVNYSAEYNGAGSEFGKVIDTSISMNDLKYLKRADVDVDVFLRAGWMFTPNFGLGIHYFFSGIEPVKIADTRRSVMGTQKELVTKYETISFGYGLRALYYF